MKQKIILLTAFGALIVLFFMSCTKDCNIIITYPKENIEISSKYVIVKGEIHNIDNFNENYTIQLYKYIDGGYYWQNTSVRVVGKQWEGQIFLQERDFSSKEKEQGFKIEGIVAVICEKDNLTQLAGYNNSGTKVSFVDVEKKLAKGLTVNQSLAIRFKNTLPSK